LLSFGPEPPVVSSAVEKCKNYIIEDYNFTCSSNAYWCETWSLILREEHRLKVFENRMLRRMFGTRKDQVTGGWRELHNEELHDLYFSPSLIGMIKLRGSGCAGHLRRMGEERNVYRLLVGKAEGKRPLGGPRHRRVDSINMDLLEIAWGGVDWIGVAQDRDNAIMNFGFHKMLGSYRVAIQLVASQVVLSSTELVGQLFEALCYKQKCRGFEA
jgi:hypothetical protein